MFKIYALLSELMENYDLGEFFLDAKERKLTRPDDERISLTPRVFDLLLMLVQNTDRVLTKDELMATIWADCTVEESNLSQSIFVLRKALGETANNPRYVRTIPHVGYRFIGPVRGVGLNSSEDRQNQKAIRRVAAKSRIMRWIGASVLVLLTGGILGGSYLMRRPIPVNGPIAILRFENRTNDGGIDFLGDGLSEDLTRCLGSSIKRPVVSYMSSRKIEDSVDISKINRTLNARLLLRGHFVREDKLLILNVELLNLADGTVVWKDSLNSESNDLLKLRNALVGIIANKLQKLYGDERQVALTDHGTRSNEAFLLYLRGKYGMDRSSKDGLILTIAPLKKAIEIDPEYALAHLALADAYNLLGTWYGERPEHFQLLAKQELETAASLDNSLSEAHTTLAKIKMDLDRDFYGSEKEFQSAIQLNPSNAQAHHWYGEVFLSAMGRFDESLKELETARSLSPLSSNIVTGIAWTYIGMKDYEKAVTECNTAISINPSDSGAYSFKAMALTKLGRYDEAIVSAQRADNLEGDKPNLAVIYALKGEKTRAREILATLIKDKANRDISAYDIAVIYGALGERQKAFEYLEKEIGSKSVDLLSIKIDPLLDSIREDPRFATLLSNLNMPNY